MTSVKGKELGLGGGLDKWRELGGSALLRGLSSVGNGEKGVAEGEAGLLRKFCMFKMQASLQRQKVKKQREETTKTVSERPQNCLLFQSFLL